MSARDLPDHVARAADLLSQLLAEYLAPPPRLSVTEWACQRRVLSAKDSSEPGPYRIERTPYAREPQDALSAYSPVEEVVLMWGAQTSKTTIGSNWLGSLIDIQPGPTMVVQPTIDTGKRFSRQRLTPMIEESPVLRRKVRENRSRDDANTTLLKEYPGGFLVVAGANSAAGLRSMPIRDIFFDEIDAYPHDVDGEGDPISLAEARQSTFARRKRLKTSTPTTKGHSRIEAAFLATDQRYYHVACPHCGARQRLVWGADQAWGIKWHKTQDGTPLPDTAHYVCQHSGCIIQEHHKDVMLAGGEWIAANPGASPRKRGYQLSTLYSPLGWFSWAELVAEWIHATALAKQGDVSKLRSFVNTRLAETFEEQGVKADHQELARRAEDYEPGTAPRGVLMVSMGVDVQGDRIEARVWGYGRGEESWLIGRHVIYGDPNLEEGTPGSPWSELTKLRRTTILHASGTQLLPEVCCIDSGYLSNAVYNYCRAHTHERVLAVDGLPGNRPALGKPKAMDITWRGKTSPRSVKLWPVGDSTVKHLLHGRMRITQPGPGYVHVPQAYRDTDEFEQMTCERLVTKYVKGHARLEWHKPAGKRNEGGDCQKYAYAGACYLGIQTMREHAWHQREQRIAPRELDLFAPPAAPAAPAPAPAGPSQPAPAPSKPPTFLQQQIAARRRRPQEPSL
jgi:phage terminase large subunit GpA-like protein